MDAQMTTREFKGMPHVLITGRVIAVIHTSLPIVERCFGKSLVTRFGMFWTFRREDRECGFYLRVSTPAGDAVKLQVCSACVHEKDADEFYLWVSDRLAEAALRHKR